MDEIYTFTIPLLKKHLIALNGILDKAALFIKEEGITEESILAEAFAPDMFPFKRQVQVACDNAKAAAARLSGMENPVFEDTESTIAELKNRIDKTLAFIATVSPESFKDTATRQIVLPYVPGKYLTGFDYVREYVIPNFFFHITTAYDLLRHKGLKIGKADFVGSMPFNDLPAAN
jgi:hypothetical protein